MSRYEQDDNFDEAGYVRVNERIAQFREEYPEGSITTFRTLENDGVSFKAVVFRNPKEVELYGATSIAPGTGHAYLSNEHFGEKVEEYTETVSVGRALANLGLSLEKSIASAEEMEKFQATQASDEEELEDDEEEELEAASDEEEEPKLKTKRKFSGKSGKTSRFRRSK